VDGPTHFLGNAPTVPNGATRLRTRLLEARGWRVVSVPVTEWDRRVAKGKQAAHDYLMTIVGLMIDCDSVHCLWTRFHAC
jgi:hypothetical protein